MNNQDLYTINQTLVEILAALGGSSSGTQGISSDTIFGDGTVPAGSYSLSFNCSDDFVGSINGIVRAPGSTVFFQAAGTKTLPSVDFSISVGSAVLDSITNIP